ncbi:MAG: acyl-CoA dehydrogenase family protein [Eubacteriales bacterium]
MAIILTEEQKELKALIREFMENEVIPFAQEYDERGEFPEEILKKAHEMGLGCMNIEEEFGGSGLNNETMAVLIEEMAYGEAGVSTSLTVSGLAYECIRDFGSQEQKKLIGEAIVAGKYISFALTEADSGSNAGAARCGYVADGDEYVINGSKAFITNASYADYHLVFATKDPALGVRGLSAFIVANDTPGVSRGKKENKMGLRLSNTSDLHFDNVRVSKDMLVGKEGLGFKMAMTSLDVGRILIGAAATGIAQRALDESVKYAKQRSPFGQPIATHQAVQFIIADMAIEIEAARLLTKNAAILKDQGMRISKEAAIAKSFASDVAMRATTDAVQILGGYGYSKEYPVEKLMRDAKVYQIFEGTNQIQRIVIAGAVLKE